MRLFNLSNFKIFCVIKGKLDQFEKYLQNYTEFLIEKVKSGSGTGTITYSGSESDLAKKSQLISDPGSTSLQWCTLSLSSSKKNPDESILIRNTSFKQMIIIKTLCCKNSYCILPRKKTTALFLVAVDTISSFLSFFYFTASPA